MASRVAVQERGRGEGGGGGGREACLWWGVWSLTAAHLVAHGNTSWWSRPTTRRRGTSSPNAAQPVLASASRRWEMLVIIM